VIRGEKPASTAEQLMRARYAAHVLGEVDFILESIHPDHLEGVDRANTELWAKESKWLGFELLATDRGGPDDDTGTVDFVARYKLRGVAVAHRERANFEKKDGRWFFVDGKDLPAPTARHEGPRVGRNDPCPCGSGKKYKKCCGKAA
jgi:SEC-C motif-containing protein